MNDGLDMIQAAQGRAESVQAKHVPAEGSVPEVGHGEAGADQKMSQNALDYLTLVDALQTLGVEPVQAVRFTQDLYKKKSTFMEAYGQGSIVKGANINCRDLNLEGLSAMDLRTNKPNGEPWDFTKLADRKLARQELQEKKPDWLVGSPPCTAFSQLMNLNYSKMAPAQIQRYLQEGRLHLHFVISLYQASWPEEGTSYMSTHRALAHGLMTRWLHCYDIPGCPPWWHTNACVAW